MNLNLVTQSSQLYGIFSSYKDTNGNQLLVTLEHAFAEGSIWVPKLARGQTYTCKRGTGPLPGGLWKLESGMVIDTFQVMDVPNFQGSPVTDLLAAHPGNWNRDSNGCICTGLSVNLGLKMIQYSEMAFKKFMELQGDNDTFQLSVS